MSDGGLILAAGILLAAGIGAALAAGRLRVPGLVLFLGLGMLLGSDGLGLIDFGGSERDVEMARTIGIIALALILFEGGLVAGWDDIRSVVAPSLSLATLGTIVSAVLTGVAAHLLLDLSWLEGFLLGSIVAGTDSAAIFSVLRGSTLKRKLARTLEAESGLNDPVAVILVLGFIEWIQDPDFGLVDLVALGLIELPIGAVVGAGVGVAAVAAFRRVSFATSGLYPVASIATAGIAFGLADVLHGSGFLAVYLAGLALGSAPIPGKRTVEDFHAGVAWVAQIALFLTLGLLVFPSELGEVAVDGLILTVVLLFVARPVAAWVGTRIGRYPVRDVALISWAGLRGALPVVFATFPVIEGIPERRPVLQPRLLRGAHLRAAAGRDVRAAGPPAGGDQRRARPLAAARGGGHDPAARGRGPRVPRGRARRHRRPGGQPARPAARCAGQRAGARGGGAAAPRLDPDRGGRPPAHPRAPEGARGGGGPVRALARRADRGAGAGGRRAARPPRGVQRAALARGGGRPGRAREGRRGDGGAQAAHAPRRPRLAGAARGRALRGHR